MTVENSYIAFNSAKNIEVLKCFILFVLIERFNIGRELKRNLFSCDAHAHTTVLLMRIDECFHIVQCGKIVFVSLLLNLLSTLCCLPAITICSL